MKIFNEGNQYIFVIPEQDKSGVHVHIVHVRPPHRRTTDFYYQYKEKAPLKITLALTYHKKEIKLEDDDTAQWLKKEVVDSDRQRYHMSVHQNEGPVIIDALRLRLSD